MSNITDEFEKLSGIMSKLGEAHNMLAKTSLSKEEYQPISGLLAKAKVELFNFCNNHKAALQNKVSEKCKHKSLADTGAGYYYCPDCDYRWTYSEYEEEGNEVSDISAAGILDKYYKPKMHWKVVNRKNVLAAMHEYASIVNEKQKSDISIAKFSDDKIDATFPVSNDMPEKGQLYNSGKRLGAKWMKNKLSIVNERKDNIPADFKQVTGHNSPKEMIAYEKGREDEQEVIMKWIEQWDGSSNSAMGTLLKKKFDEKKDNVGVWVNVGDRLPDAKINGDKILLFRDTNESQKGLSISVFNTIFVKYCETSSYWMPLPAPPESQPQQKEVDEDEMPPL